MSIDPNTLEDYSPSSTIIKFDPPIPLLRRPIPASGSDDPSKSLFVLGFKNPQTWSSAFQSCESKILEQCEAGARIGCAISASNKCKPPWWKALIMGNSGFDLKERESCEEREMACCVANSRDMCVGFSKNKCLNPFRDARIAVNERKVGLRLIWLASTPVLMEKSVLMRIKQLGSCNLSEFVFGVTNYRGNVLLGSDSK